MNKGIQWIEVRMKWVYGVCWFTEESVTSNLWRVVTEKAGGVVISTEEIEGV